MANRDATREFDLAAACCRWPASPARDIAVRAAAVRIDWPRFLRIARRHRIEGLAHQALNLAGVAIPTETANALAERAAEIARQGLSYAVQTYRLQAALDQAGIGNLVLKGAALEVLAYGGLGLKSAWDIDLLVAPADAAAARTVLEGAGYDLADPPCATAEVFDQWIGLSKESVFRHRQDGFTVELHWRLVDGDLLPGLGAASPSQRVKLAPALEVRTLAPPELFAYLTVHGTSHGWSRLKWLADIAALLAGLDDTAIEHLYWQAVRMGAGQCPAVTLRLGRRLFGAAIPAGLTRELQAGGKARRLASFAINMLAGEREILERPFASERILLSQLLFADGWRYRLREFRRQWTSVHDQQNVRLPDGLAFLYHLIRAPLWLWRRIRRP